MTKKGKSWVTWQKIAGAGPRGGGEIQHANPQFKPQNLETIHFLFFLFEYP